MTPTLSAFHIYPIKSAGGISLDRWTIDAFGPRYDRRWMVVDDDGVFISQRQEPRMALVRTALLENRLQLSAHGHEPVSLPLEPPPVPRERVEVWSDVVGAEPCDVQVDRWLSGVLGRGVHLVRMPEDVVRQVDRRYANPGERTAFSDGYPFLLIGSASLDDLNARMPLPLPMNRFRPNLVIAGTPPFAEDGWARIAIGEIVFRVAKPCGRCVVTTTDQDTGERGVEPLRTLATFRRSGSKVLFGQNLVHEGTGAIEVGAPLRVLESKAD